MEISRPDLSLRPENTRKVNDLHFTQLEDGLGELKADVAERPFLWLAIVFAAGFVSHTFPVRFLFLVVIRLISWLAGPVILLMGIVKISDLFFTPRRSEPTILPHP